MRFLCRIGLHEWDEETRYDQDLDRQDLEINIASDWNGAETVRVVERCLHCKKQRYREFEIQRF